MSKATVFCLIIPCYNEEQAIPRFLEGLTLFKADFQTHFLNSYLQVVFVNNNSTDSSKKLLSNYQMDYPDISLIDCLKQGYGAALKFGFSAVRADFYSFLDLDNTYPFDALIQGYAAMLSDDSLDMVMTNRFSNKSEMPVIRGLGNRFFAGLVQILFSRNISDACSGLRIIHSRRIQDVVTLSCDSLDFSIQLTCLSLKKNWSVIYLDMDYYQRDGESKLSIIKDGLSFLKVVLKTKFFE